MTVNEYISQRFQKYGINLSEADLIDICLNAKVDGEDEIDKMDENNKVFIYVAMAKFIPSLSLRPTSVNEGGFSVSWDTKGIRDYYSLLCKQYGLTDELSEKPKATFL